jgi:DNA-binding NarL/FixJ family response regulator
MIKKKNRIIIADDHALFRQGLKLILHELDDIEVIADVANGKELLETVDIVLPDLIIMDINMPLLNGIEASRILGKNHPDIPILVVSMYGDELYYNSVIENGVRGFILKTADNDELKMAIRTIINGKTYFSQELLLGMIRNRQTPSNINLTRRELEILELICQGSGTAEISGKLFLSERTVENHKASLFSKTGCKNSLSLVIFAVKNNLVTLKSSDF